MKKIICLGFMLTIIGSLGAKNLITEHEGIVSAALSELKFESVPGKPGLVGAPPQMRITKQTIEYLEKLHKEAKIIEVQPNGSLKVIARRP